jgi:hypothetical protein
MQTDLLRAVKCPSVLILGEKKKSIVVVFAFLIDCKYWLAVSMGASSGPSAYLSI